MGGRVHHADDSSHRAFLDCDPAVVALAYASAGLPVIPLHTPDGTGGCSCRRDCGRDAGKHPRTLDGLKSATTYPARIDHWWGMWPDANPAVATGADAGVIVIDVDAGTGGEASLAALEAEHGLLPETWAVETGGRGMHLWFRHPGGWVKTTAGKLGPGLDVRADGGYVVVPPSLHRSGVRYRWADAWRPDLVRLADPPPWLRELIVRATPPASEATGMVEGAILGGKRNGTLASLAGTMRRRGMTEVAIIAALHADNAARCIPPLDPAEVNKIAHSVARYPPASVAPNRHRSRARSVEFVNGKAVAR